MEVAEIGDQYGGFKGDSGRGGEELDFPVKPLTTGDDPHGGAFLTSGRGEIAEKSFSGVSGIYQKH
jgi:hypothetical protein